MNRNEEIFWDRSWQAYLRTLKAFARSSKDWAEGIEASKLDENFIRALKDAFETQDLSSIVEFKHDNPTKLENTLAENLFWRCVSDGIFFPYNYKGSLPTFVRITPFGFSFLKSIDSVNPYDSKEYIENLCRKIPKLQEDNDGIVVFDFLKEALRALEAHCDQAAMVMLGCASEKIIHLMMCSFRKAFPKTEQPFDGKKYFQFSKRKQKFFGSSRKCVPLTKKL